MFRKVLRDPVRAEVFRPAPTPAKEAGMRGSHTIRVVALLPTLGRKLYPGSSYLRLIRPLGHANLRGRLVFSVATTEQVMGTHADVVVVQRTAIGDEATARSLAHRCRRHGIRLVYELDDDLFDVPAGHAEAGQYRSQTRGARMLAELADLVTVPTKPLASRLFERNPNVRVIGNCLDERLWLGGIAPFQPFRFRRPLRVLYMGTRTHRRDLRLVEEPMRQIVGEHRGRVQFECIGGMPIGMEEDWYRPLGVPRRGRQYPGFVRWLRRRRRWDIGIAPLEDSEFNRCKSPLKFLDYCALGLAAVCSDVAPYREVVRDGVNGLLVPRSPDAWYAALKRLINDESLRKRIARHGQDDLRRDHTLRTRSWVWLHAYERLGLATESAAGAVRAVVEV